VLLAIDIGNTNVTYGVFRGEELRASWRMETDVRRQADEYFALNVNLLSFYRIGLKEITQGIISSVVPPLIATFQEVFQRFFNVRPLILETGTKTGMRILYENPREVGADRVAHAVAAFRKYGGPVIVIDFGTATVFDAITAEGDYLGGAIAPGINLAAEALFARASKLPRIEIARPKNAIGRNTVASMQAGLYYGYVGLVEGMVARFQRELGGGAKVIATGGLAGLIAQDTKVIENVDSDLVLIGLRMIHDLNEDLNERAGRQAQRL
jgi:type III pantothenate kinase